LLAIGQPAAPDCGRYRDGPDLQPCEFVRDEQADILEAAHRPSAGRLGSEAIRFSSRPQLGGRAAVVEIVRRGRGQADVRLFTFIGHWRTRWEPQDDDQFLLPAAEYRQLAAQVDAALARYREPVPDPNNGETIVCMDGPGFLTERVKGARVTSLVGQCPRLWRKNIPTATSPA
jgi:hypothetical protein